MSVYLASFRWPSAISRMLTVEPPQAATCIMSQIMLNKFLLCIGFLGLHMCNVYVISVICMVVYH